MSGSRFKVLALSVMLLTACSKAPIQLKGSSLEGAPFEMHWSLINDKGEPSLGSEFKGKVSLIYFGYTECPDVCFATLQRVQKAIQVLEAEKVDTKDLSVIFISIDTEHDTPPVLKNYMSHFGPQFVGLTGSEANIQAAIKDFKVYSEKQKSPRAFEHSGILYGFDRQQKPRDLIDPDRSVEDIAFDLKALLSERD